MKALYIYGYCGLGGVETSVINKMKVLQKMGIESDAAFMNLWTENGKLILNHPHIKAGLNRVELIEMIQRNYDIITVIDYPEFFYITRNVKFKSKILYETHTSSLQEMRKTYSVINHPSISGILVPSQFNRNKIMRFTGTNKSIWVLCNPIDFELFSNKPIDQLSTEIRQYSNKKNVIWIGRLERNKNPLEFIKLGVDLLCTNQDFNFIIIGDKCGDISYYQRVINSIPDCFTAFFRFISAVPNEKMHEYYSLAANTGGCLVSTSINESLPMVFLEAMACRCPVVATGVGGTKELIQSNITGKLYELHSISEGSRAIKELVLEENKQSREQIVESAYQRVLRRHSFEKVGADYKSILEIIL